MIKFTRLAAVSWSFLDEVGSTSIVEFVGLQVYEFWSACDVRVYDPDVAVVLDSALVAALRCNFMPCGLISGRCTLNGYVGTV